MPHCIGNIRVARGFLLKNTYSFKKWGDNVTNPVWDEERWWINYVLHPYRRGAYYIRGRERGLDRTQ